VKREQEKTEVTERRTLVAPAVKRLAPFLFLLLAIFLGRAAPIKFDLLKAGSRTYTNVTVIGFNEAEIYIRHNGGLGNIKLRNLEPEVQKRFNYDPHTAEAAERKEAEDDARYVATLASNSVAQLEKTSRAAKKAAATSAESLADAVSENSLIGKPLPSFKGAKWLGTKPSLEGKVVLVTFWTSWSFPCRKYIPDWNSLQKKFGDKIVVMGVTSEPEQDVTAMPEPKVEFAVAIDLDGVFSGEAGVASVPHVLLVDRKGVVRYQGHPAALTEREVARWVGKEESQ